MEKTIAKPSFNTLKLEALASGQNPGSGLFTKYIASLKFRVRYQCRVTGQVVRDEIYHQQQTGDTEAEAIQFCLIDMIYFKRRPVTTLNFNIPDECIITEKVFHDIDFTQKNQLMQRVLNFIMQESTWKPEPF